MTDTKRSIEGAPWLSMLSAPKDGSKYELLVQHRNYQYAEPHDRPNWLAAVVGHWINFNHGGWTWTGMYGEVIGWRSLVESNQSEVSPTLHHPACDPKWPTLCDLCIAENGEASGAGDSRLSDRNLSPQTEPEPSGYAYRYHDFTGTGTMLRFNGGGEVNGARPIEAVPYWFAPPLSGRVWNQALEAAATAISEHDRKGREWIPGSLWDQLSREAAVRIRNLKRPSQVQDPEIGCTRCGWEGTEKDATLVIQLGAPIAHHKCPKCGTPCTTACVSVPLEPSASRAVGEQSAQVTDDLPSLPEPVDQLAQADGFNVIGVADVFTAEQMCEYAHLALSRVQAETDAFANLDFTPDEHHTVADMANVGYSLMQAIKVHRPNYCWNESPAEIVGDLSEELDELSRVQAVPDEKLLSWALERWTAEVANRPLVNVHRRTLDGTWRQIIRHAGGDDVLLIGPPHDDLIAAAASSVNEQGGDAS